MRSRVEVKEMASPWSLMLMSWLSSATKAAWVADAGIGVRLAAVSVTRENVPAARFVTGSSSPDVRSAGAYAGIWYIQISRLASRINGLLFGVAVGDGVGVGDGLPVGVGLGLGTGEVHAFPSKFPGLVEFKPHGVVEYAFDANAIHLPSLLITGRLFTILTLML